ncbi:hypothetical protein A4X09_0g6210 [Tilletia walkeri]|uniref:Uncharacterized protein n=1 Tax=Tilletia walkeri TaxID=117179 RepID=A0A8X7N4A6_9BASI|nr:hypothetical protein A4X09_0g6210 [Tilletia walkeri]
MTQSTASRNARNRRKKAKRARETASEAQMQSQDKSQEQGDLKAEQGTAHTGSVPQEDVAPPSPAKAKVDDQVRHESEIATSTEQADLPSASSSKAILIPSSSTRTLFDPAELKALTGKAKAARMVGKRRVGAARPRPRHVEDEVEVNPTQASGVKQQGEDIGRAGSGQSSASEQRKRWKRVNATMGADIAAPPPPDPAHEIGTEGRTPYFDSQGLPSARILEQRGTFPHQRMQEHARMAHQQALDELNFLNAESTRAFTAPRAFTALPRQGAGGGGGYTLFQPSSLDQLRSVMDQIDNSQLSGGRFREVTPEEEEAEIDQDEVDLDSRDWVDEEGEDEIGEEYDEDANLLSLSRQQKALRAYAARKGRGDLVEGMKTQTIHRGRSPTVRPRNRDDAGEEGGQHAEGTTHGGQRQFGNMLPGFLKSAKESDAYSRGADLLERHMQQIRITPASPQDARPRASMLPSQPVGQDHGGAERSSGSVREQKRRRRDTSEAEERAEGGGGTNVEAKGSRPIPIPTSTASLRHEHQQREGFFKRHGFIPASHLTREQAAVEEEYAYLRARQRALETATVITQGVRMQQQRQQHEAAQRSDSSRNEAGQMAQLDIADAVAQAMAQSSAEVWAAHEQANGEAYDNDDDEESDSGDPDDDGRNELGGSSLFFSGTETRDEDDQDGRSMCAELHDGWMSASAPDVFDWTTNPVLADESFLQAQRDEDDFQSRRRYSESDAEVGRRFLHGEQAHGNAYGHGQTAVYAGPQGDLMNAPGALAEHPCPVLREYGFVSASGARQEQTAEIGSGQEGVYCMPFSRVPLRRAEDVERAIGERRLVPVGIALDVHGDKHQIVAWRPTEDELLAVHGEGLAERLRAEMGPTQQQQEAQGPQQGYGMVSAEAEREDVSDGQHASAAEENVSGQNFDRPDTALNEASERPDPTPKGDQHSTGPTHNSLRCVNCGGKHEHDHAKCVASHHATNPQRETAVRREWEPPALNNPSSKLDAKWDSHLVFRDDGRRVCERFNGPTPGCVASRKMRRSKKGGAGVSGGGETTCPYGGVHRCSGCGKADGHGMQACPEIP